MIAPGVLYASFIDHFAAPGGKVTGVPNAPAERLQALDSVRGLAALVVVFGHCFLILDFGPAGEPAWLIRSPLHLLINGHAAVILFFVLSGYVLSIPFWRGSRQSYPQFLVRRVCRIFLPFAFAILFAALLYAFTPKADPSLGSAWFRTSWGDDALTAKAIAGHFLMTGRVQDMWLNQITWSLVYEMRVSLIFPVLVLFCRSTPIGVGMVAGAFVTAAAMLLVTGFPSLLFGYRFPPTLLLTLYYSSYFGLGVLLAKHHAALDAWLKRLPAAAVVGLFALAVTTLAMAPNLSSHPAAPTAPSALLQADWLRFAPDALIGLAAGALIVLVRSFGSARTPFNPLRSPPVEWLGKVSYSLYLMHYPIAFFIARRLLDEVPFALVALLIVGASLIVSGLFHHMVERPSMALGKALTGARRRPAFA